MTLRRWKYLILMFCLRTSPLSQLKDTSAWYFLSCSSLFFFFFFRIAFKPDFELMPYRHPAIKRCLYILFICVVVVDRSFNRTLSNPKEVHNCYLIRGLTGKKTLLRSNWPQTLWHENIWNIKCFVFIGVTTILFILQLGLWQREELPLRCFSTHWALIRSLEKKKKKYYYFYISSVGVCE